MDSTKKRNNGTLKTVYEDDENFNGSSAEPPTVEATPRVTRGRGTGSYQREIERLTRQLIEREQQVKLQEEPLLQYATPVKPSVTDPTLTSRVPRPQDIAYMERLRRQKEQGRDNENSINRCTQPRSTTYDPPETCHHCR